jgi:hypothetical protein
MNDDGLEVILTVVVVIVGLAVMTVVGGFLFAVGWNLAQ